MSILQWKVNFHKEIFRFFLFYFNDSKKTKYICLVNGLVDLFETRGLYENDLNNLIFGNIHHGMKEKTSWHSYNGGWSHPFQPIFNIFLLCLCVCVCEWWSCKHKTDRSKWTMADNRSFFLLVLHQCIFTDGKWCLNTFNSSPRIIEKGKLWIE